MDKTVLTPACAQWDECKGGETYWRALGEGARGLALEQLRMLVIGCELCEEVQVHERSISIDQRTARTHAAAGATCR